MHVSTHHEAPRDAGRVVVFDLADQAYALPMADVREIAFISELSRPASLPSILHGFLNLGGSAVPVLDLRRLLGLPPRAPGLHTPLVILKAAERPLALVVDRVQGVSAAEEADRMPLTAERSVNGCVEAEVALGDRVLHLLSSARLLLEEERRCVEEMRDAEQQRLQRLAGPAA